MSQSTSSPPRPVYMEPEGETFLEKAKRKTIEEPLVPAGAAATVLALYMATRQFRRGNRTSMNQWLRFRVAAQGFTLLAICTYGFMIRARRAAAREAGQDPATHLQNATDRQQAKEKEEFQKRLDDAIKASDLEMAKNAKIAEQEAKEGKQGKVDWKEAWKAGILKKNAENDEKRIRPSDRAP